MPLHLHELILLTSQLLLAKLMINLDSFHQELPYIFVTTFFKIMHDLHIVFHNFIIFIAKFITLLFEPLMLLLLIFFELR